MNVLRWRPEIVPSLFGELPGPERFHVWARAFSAPLHVVAQRAPSGRIADIGCGHGLLTALLARHPFEREVLGVDPDARKIMHARQSAGRLHNVYFEQGTAESLLGRERGRFDGVVVSDVLYLLPAQAWAGFLAQCHGLLKPGGRLLLKEACGDGSWKHYKCLAQEWLMVSLLKRTQGSGGLSLVSDGVIRQLLHDSGFEDIRAQDLSRGYTTPHVLYEARRLE